MTKPTGKPRGRPRKPAPLPDAATDAPPKRSRGRPRKAAAPDLFSDLIDDNAEPEKRRGPGQPRKEIDLKLVYRLALIQCTDEEIAAVLGVSGDVLTDRKKNDPAFMEALRGGKANGRRALRRKQWQRAMNGSDTMLIWLGKNLMGQTDKVESTILTPEEVRRVAEAARFEASRRGHDADLAGRPVAGTLPN